MSVEADAPPIVATLMKLSGRAEGYAGRKLRTRQRIVDAASAMMIESGYRRTSMEAIAAAAAVSRATLYTYARTKGDLLVMVVAEEALGQLEKVRAVYDPALPAEQRLRAVVREAVVYIVSMPVSARLARDGDPDAMRVLREHQLIASAQQDSPELDKGRYYASLFEAVAGDTLSSDEACKLAAMVRALSHLAPGLLDEEARFGLSVEELGELVSKVVVDGVAGRSR